MSGEPTLASGCDSCGGGSIVVEGHPLEGAAPAAGAVMESPSDVPAEAPAAAPSADKVPEAPAAEGSET